MKKHYLEQFKNENPKSVLPPGPTPPFPPLRIKSQSCVRHNYYRKLLLNHSMDELTNTTRASVASISSLRPLIVVWGPLKIFYQIFDDALQEYLDPFTLLDERIDPSYRARKRHYCRVHKPRYYRVHICRRCHQCSLVKPTAEILQIRKNRASYLIKKKFLSRSFKSFLKFIKATISNAVHVSKKVFSYQD